MTDFLKLNNIPIPVLDGSAQYSFEEQGNRQRTMDGQLRTTRTSLKRVWRFETPILDPEVALMVAGLIAGNGHHWSYDVDAFDLKGFGPIDPATPNAYSMRKGLVDNPAQPVSQPGETFMKYGGAIAVEKAITNLFSANVRTGTDFSANTAGFATIDAFIVFQSTDVPALGQGWVALQGTRVLEFTASGAVNGIRAGIKTTGVVGVAATKYTASVYVQANTAVRCQLKDVTNGVNGTIQTVNPASLGANIGQPLWTRISSTVTTGGAVPTLEFEVLEDVADSGANFFMDMFQLESSEGPTSWADGARGNGHLRCDVQNFIGSGRTVSEDIRTAVDLTVMFWVSRGVDGFTADWRSLFWITQDYPFGTAAPNDPRRGHYVGMDVLYGVGLGDLMVFNALAGGNEDGSSGSLTIAALPTVPINTWVHVALVVRRNALFGTDANKFKLYINGVLASQSLVTGVNEALPNFSKTRALYIGTLGNLAPPSSEYLNGGMLDDLVIVPYVMTPTAISAVFSAGRAFSDLPRLDAEGAGIVTPPPRPIVLGELPSGEFVQAHFTAALTQNARTVQITLTEV